MRQIVTLGSQDTLEEKTVTVCYGSDFVNVTFINFCATRKDIAQVRDMIDTISSRSFRFLLCLSLLISFCNEKKEANKSKNGENDENGEKMTMALMTHIKKKVKKRRSEMKFST